MQARLDDFKLKIPLVGMLILKAGSGNLTGSLAGLLDSGVPLLQAMRTSSRVTGNAVLEAAINEAAENIATGRRLSDELERLRAIPSYGCSNDCYGGKHWQSPGRIAANLRSVR